MITAMGDVMRRAYEKGWITTRDGNVSLRRSGSDIMYVTPSGWRKTIIHPEHMIKVRLIPAGLEILDNHAAMITVLKEGTVKIDLADDHMKFNDLNGHIERDKSDDKILRMQINGGVVEVNNNKVIVLAD